MSSSISRKRRRTENNFEFQNKYFINQQIVDRQNATKMKQIYGKKKIWKKSNLLSFDKTKIKKIYSQFFRFV